MRRRLGIAAWLGSGLGLAVSAGAGPLNSAWVPADASWVVHVDVEAGVGSTVGRFLVQERGVWGPNQCEAFRARTGIDPARDIRGVTIYGPTCDETHAVAIIDGTSATDTFLEKLRAEEKSFERIAGEKHTLDTWMEHGSARYGFVRKEGDRRLIMVSRDRSKLEEAITLAEGGAKTGESPALAMRPREGSFLFVAALGVGAAADGGKAVVVRKMQDLRLDVGEAGGALYGDMVVTTATPQEAKDVLQMLEGAAAMGRMMAQSRPELEELVEVSRSVSLSASDSSVRATFSFDSGRAVGMLRAIAEKRRAGADAAKAVEKGGSGDGGVGTR